MNHYYMSIIAVLLVKVTIVAVIVRLRQRKPKYQERITVSLDDLSVLWLKYNDEVAPVLYDKTEEVTTLARPAKEEKETSVDEGIEEHLKKASEASKASTDQKKLPPKEAPQPVVIAPKPAVIKDGLIAFREDLKPYMTYFEEQGAKTLLETLIGELGEYGHCSSMVSDPTDSETIELSHLKDSYGRVTLKYHTIGVAKHGLSLLKETYSKDHYKEYIPAMVIAALAHDIGKIPEWHASGVYQTKDHPLISAARLKDLADDTAKKAVWFQEVVRAVKNHHKHTKDQFTHLLKDADKGAREYELEKYCTSFAVKETEEWFDPARYVEELAPHVNAVKKGVWKAFSYKGDVYCRPDVVYEVARKMCDKAKAIDKVFLYASDVDTATRRIVRLLKEQEYVPDVMRQNEYTIMVMIKAREGRDKVTKKKMRIIPFNGEYFSNLGEIDKRRTGYLEGILEVEQT